MPSDHEIVGLIASMATKLADARREGVPLCLVGVRSRGVPLAQKRLAPRAAAAGGAKISTWERSTSRSTAMISAKPHGGPCCGDKSVSISWRRDVIEKSDVLSRYRACCTDISATG